MTHNRFHFLRIGCICLSSTLVSCQLLSETGPLKSSITDPEQSYRLVPIQKASDIPSGTHFYGVGEVPKSYKGPAYSDRISPRDRITFVITDLAEESPFHSDGSFGPIEVPADGIIEIPYVGSIQVIGKLLSEVSADLNEKIKSVSNTARSSVTRSDRLPLNANVIGKVKSPGPVPLDRAGINSLDLLAAAGGPSDSEHLFSYNLRRNGRDYKFDYLGFREKPFPVEEGDLLSVSTDSSKRFHVMGAINRPITVHFPLPVPTLADALGAATGFDERRSDPSGVFVFREGNPGTVYTFDLKRPELMQLIQRFTIEGNDIVYVTEAPLARWNRLISQILPSVTQATTSAYRFNHF
jgi:protein involved in polysaccharide export with SLBB domain